MENIENLYIDTSLLAGFVLSLMEGETCDTRLAEFISGHKEKITAYISILSVAELVKIMKTGKEFKIFQKNDKKDNTAIINMIEKMIETIGLKTIEKENSTIRPEVIDFVFLHHHVLDCLHVGIAKHNNLWFITHEKHMGELKLLYEKIMTDGKLVKQKFD